MSKQVQDAYIVAASRTPIGRSHRGFFRNTRPDDLLVAAIQAALAQVPGLDPKAIEDAIVGCAMPEAEQGANIARIGALPVPVQIMMMLERGWLGIKKLLPKGPITWHLSPTCRSHM